MSIPEKPESVGAHGAATLLARLGRFTELTVGRQTRTQGLAGSIARLLDVAGCATLEGGAQAQVRVYGDLGGPGRLRPTSSSRSKGSRHWSRSSTSWPPRPRAPGGDLRLALPAKLSVIVKPPHVQRILPTGAYAISPAREPRRRRSFAALPSPADTLTVRQREYR